MYLCPLLHGQINFIDLGEETAKPSWCHSYRSSFKRQVIALPSHGQNTAAVKPIVTGQAGPLMLWFARGDVFGKQARLVFAEFLLFLWVFPCGHSCVGLTISCVGFSRCLLWPTVPSWLGFVICRWGVRSDLHMCWERVILSYYSF